MGVGKKNAVSNDRCAREDGHNTLLIGILNISPKNICRREECYTVFVIR